WQRLRRRRPFIQKRVRELLATSRSAADQGIELGVNEKVGKPSSVVRTPRPAEPLAELRAGQTLAIPQGSLEEPAAPGADGPTEIQRSVVMGQDCADARSSECEQPANVGRPHEVPGGTHDMGAEDGSVVEETVEIRVGRPRDPLTDGPLRPGVVL